MNDEPEYLESLQRTLRSHQHDWEIACAPSGETALALMEASPFDAVVSDIHLPGMGGAALLDRVREEHPHVVRIALSGPGGNGGRGFANGSRGAPVSGLGVEFNLGGAGPFWVGKVGPAPWLLRSGPNPPTGYTGDEQYASSSAPKRS